MPNPTVTDIFNIIKTKTNLQGNGINIFSAMRYNVFGL